MNDLILLGLSHKTAPVEVRERVAFSEDQLPDALRRLHSDFGVIESVIYSTCNRVELLARSRGTNGVEELKNFLCSYHAIAPSHLDDYLYVHRKNDAIRHVFRVASSLDSMVVGEPQILAQLKQAYLLARKAGSLGSLLNSLLPRAFFVAKRVRTETRVANSAVSISSVAVELARKIFGDLRGKSILVLGAGKMGELAARNLVESGVSEVFVSNRTPHRAHALAAKFKGSFIPFENLDPYLVKADIVLVSTGSQQFVLDKKQMLPILPERRYRPLFIIDISVPRNVDPLVNEIENIFLYDIDDLQAVLQSNLSERQKEAEIAEAIVQQEVHNYVRRLSINGAGPLIGQLRKKVEAICLEELDKQRAGMDPEQYDLMQQAALRAAHRIAHPIILKMKQSHQNPKLQVHDLELIRQMFELDDE